MHNVGVVVVAAGQGERLGAGVPKAFALLRGRALLEWSLDAIREVRDLGYVVVVAPETHRVQASAIAERSQLGDRVTVVAGGATRGQSVARGLRALPSAVSTVLVHDAARALTPSALFDTVATAVASSGNGVIPVLPITDTVKQLEPSGGGCSVANRTLDRDTLAAAQTPQGFPRDVIEAAYSRVTECTDDAALVAAAGFDINTVPGDVRAEKITTPEDMKRMNWELSEQDATAGLRIGTGVDVHAFANDPTIPLWLAGMHWPGEVGLAGHSDGDVVCHALCDALLAAAGLGDLGTVFGTDDPRFRDARGATFVTETRSSLIAAGFRVVNVSVQLIGNRPRFAPRRSEAETLLSRALDAPVSVSATTADGLGFTGRDEGLAAIATALVNKVQR